MFSQVRGTGPGSLLAVGQARDEREERHQRQVRRIFRRLPVLRVEVGNIGAGEQGAKRVVHLADTEAQTYFSPIFNMGMRFGCLVRH